MPLDEKLDALLGSFDTYKDEPKPIDAMSTLVQALEGIAVAEDLPRLNGSPLHQWFEEVSNAVHPLAFAETIDREMRRVGSHAATSQPAEHLLSFLCKRLELIAWNERQAVT